jgi:hypothetical protein
MTVQVSLSTPFVQLNKIVIYVLRIVKKAITKAAVVMTLNRT